MGDVQELPASAASPSRDFTALSPPDVFCELQDSFQPRALQVVMGTGLKFPLLTKQEPAPPTRNADAQPACR